MALASPTPLGSSLSSYLNSRQTFNKQIPSRLNLSKSDMSTPRNYNLGDSSDEEIPVPTFKCSALTSALLNDVAVSPDSHISRPKTISPGPEQYILPKLRERNTSPQYERQKSSPNTAKEKNVFPRRKVRLSRVPDTSAFRRSKSVPQVDFVQNGAHHSQIDSPLKLSTPAPVPRRVVRIPNSIESNVNPASSPSGHPSRRNSSSPRDEREIESQEYPGTVSRPNQLVSQGSVSKYGQSTIGRVRYAEDAGVKKIAGAFMSVRPRRGRRHISDGGHSSVEENLVPSTQEAEIQMSQPNSSLGRGTMSSQEDQQVYGSLYQKSNFCSGSPISSNMALNLDLRAKSSIISNSKQDFSDSKETKESNHSLNSSKPNLEVAAPRPSLPSKNDQENELPTNLKRYKQASSLRLENIEKAPSHICEENNPIKDEIVSERPPLAIKNQNTPQRLAPPPPKLSILEAATSTAGAATISNQAGKRTRMKINGKIFARLDCIGRGGSSRVYRVMAENSKFFALKKVSLEDADENTIKGFKGEIDLLKKLENVERVIRLYDYELNENKGFLSVLMELGELDMNKILDVRLKSENSKFDPSFVRYYWKEMLECLQAIHEHDVVHSDLKPHNFVLVQGQLKLIDFGIANAIQTDETVNVHRETQIGTPNYMSPESLMDFNARPDIRGRIPNAPKLMKLGKPSDIWSLGCILYQMTYGHAPFAHIQNQMSRCQAIVNFNYAIGFPSVGVGDVPVPSSLIQTLKKCLNRNQQQRPTASELLSYSDPFLYPNELDQKEIAMTETLLGRILLNVASKFREKIPSDTELLKIWPQAYFDRIRRNKVEINALESQTAKES